MVATSVEMRAWTTSVQPDGKQSLEYGGPFLRAAAEQFEAHGENRLARLGQVVDRTRTAFDVNTARVDVVVPALGLSIEVFWASAPDGDEVRGVVLSKDGASLLLEPGRQVLDVGGMDDLDLMDPAVVNAAAAMVWRMGRAYRRWVGTGREVMVKAASGVMVDAISRHLRSKGVSVISEDSEADSGERKMLS